MLTKSTFTNTPDIRAAAPGGSGAGHAASSPFWRRNAEASLSGRIQAINKINDPTIMTDNVLRWVKVALVILLAATGLIGALNYWKFFSLTLGNVYIVAFLTVAIAGLVEFGKYFATKWAIRYPFFNTFRAIFSEAHSTLIWVGLLLVAGLTFVLSAYNSTKGAEQLSYLIAHESAEGQAVFTPQTAEIDAQIANAQNVQASALSNRISTGKYKGMVDWQSSKTAKNAGASAATLIAQKQQIVEQQRQDWERQQGERSQNVNHAASYVLKIGGWLELLQFILMFVRVACEKQLASHPDAQPRLQHKPGPSPSNGSQFNGQPATDYNYHNTYFNRGPNGNVVSVSQPITPVPPTPTTPSPVQGPQSEVLFKQTGDLFKQIWEGGKVVGLMYRKKDGIWQPLSFADVRSRWSIYTQRGENKPSPAVMAGREQWQWAMQQFDEGRVEAEPTIPASRFLYDKPIAEQVLERFGPLSMEAAEG